MILGRRRRIAAELVPVADDPRAIARVPTFAATRPAASPNLATADLGGLLLGGYPRDAALSIPAVSTCRDLIVGAVVQMHPERFRGTERVEPGTLLTEPDPDTTWARTIAGTVEDLIYDGVGYWLVLATDGIATSRNPEGLPVRARWIPTRAIEPVLSRDRGAYSRLEGYRIDGIRRVVEPRHVIRFDSPIPPVLVKGAAAIARALNLEAKADRLSTVDLPAGVITNEGAELSEPEAEDLVDRFETARRSHTVAFLQNATYERTELNADDLQLVEARARMDAEMARLHNVPVALVGTAPTGGGSAMLYSNLGTTLALLVSNAVAPYLSAIEQTLSRPNVTPNGQRVALDVATFLRTDPKDLAEYVRGLVKDGVISPEQGRRMLGISDAAGDLQPGTE